MSAGWTTVKEAATASFVERKSEFIGHITPVKTEEEAIAFVNKIKKQYADAKHNVYAYLLRENNITRFSDDGEPHGTAGLPVLDVLRKAPPLRGGAYRPGIRRTVRTAGAGKRH